MNRKFMVVGQGSGDSGSAGKAGPVSEHRITRDRIIENNLILLLSETAQSMDEIDGASDNRPVGVLKALSDIVNRMAEFSEGVLKADPEEGFLAEELERAAGSYTNINLLHVENNRISPQTAVNLYKGWTGDGKERNSMFRQISLGIVHIIESYFELISDSFDTTYIADEWKDAFRVCSGELRELVNRIPF
ncbi:MAG: hypothetical protein RIG61_03490 [Deltaproteobacteria bacterium]